MGHIKYPLSSHCLPISFSFHVYRFSKRLSMPAKWYEESTTSQIGMDSDPSKATSFGKDELTKPLVEKVADSEEKSSVDDEEKGQQKASDKHKETKEETTSLKQDGKDSSKVDDRTTLTTSNEKLSKNVESKPPKSVSFKMAKDDEKPASPQDITTAKLLPTSINNDNHEDSKEKPSSPSVADKKVVTHNRKDTGLLLEQSGATSSSQPSQIINDDSLDMAALEAELRNVMEYMEIEEKKAKKEEATEDITNVDLDTEQATWL